MNVFYIFIILILIASCNPKAPEYPRLYSSEELKYYPKDSDGNPKGYKVVYSRTGINSVHYIKQSDLY